MMSLNSTRVQAPADSIAGIVDRIDELAALNSVPEGVVEDRPVTLDQKNNPKKYQKILKPILSCKNDSFIGTLNVRTVRENYKRLELAKCFTGSGLKLLGIQEHRVVHEEDIKIERFRKGVHLLTLSAWRNECGAANGGVGMVLARAGYEAISLIKSYGKRILLVSFNGNPRLTVITVYSPTEAAADEEAEDFHSTLRAAIHEVPAHHLLIVLGDFNARLGKTSADDRQWYFHSTTNRNGGLLRDTMDECQLEATNHRFQKKPGKMWTFLSDGTLNKALLDYVLVRKKWKNSVKNTEACNSFSSIGSDHRVVVSKVKLSLRKKQHLPQAIKYDFQPLKTDSQLQEDYAVEVSNSFSALASEMDSNTATIRYEKFLEAIKCSNEKLLKPVQRKKSEDPASELKIVEARSELALAKGTYHASPSEAAREVVSSKKDNLLSCYTSLLEQNITTKIARAEQAADRCKNRESWRLVNEVTGRKKRGISLVEGGSAKGRLDAWTTHFRNLLGLPPQVPDENMDVETVFPSLDIRADEFDVSELIEAKKQIKEGKAYGDDGIAPEIIKRVDVDDLVLEFCNKAMSNSDIPEHWKRLNIIPVPKKGDLTKTENYRGIALTSVVSKTLNRMILNRIRPVLDPLLRINQNGFRAGRSTTSHILALRRILEEVKDKNLSAVMLFIDFRKAFDSIHRGLLMKILVAYGIPQEIVDLIRNMYDGTLAKVLTDDGLTEAFLILAGVMQGDTLAPYLFIIVIDYVMRKCLKGKDFGITLQQRRSRRHPTVKLEDTDFADDLTLLSDSTVEAQEFLLCIEEAANSVGLHLNESKTKYLTVNCPDTTIKAKNGNIERVVDFVYLGSWIDNTIHDFKVRKAKAWKACNELKKIWKSAMRKDLKIRLFQATVESILLYGSETWTVTESLAKRIDGCYTRMLKMVLDVHWPTKISNHDLYGKLPKITSKIRERRMKLAGHIWRHDDLAAHKVLFWDPKHGQRSRGRPRKSYVDILLHDTGLGETVDIQRLMENRVLWRNIIPTREFHSP